MEQIKNDQIEINKEVIHKEYLLPSSEFFFFSFKCWNILKLIFL